MSVAQPTTVLAHAFADPKLAPVQWAVRLAEHVGPHLKVGSTVVVSFSGMRGVSSSYFNALLLKLLEFATVEQLHKRVSFETDSNAQRQILDRSVQAVLAARGK